VNRIGLTYFRGGKAAPQGQRVRTTWPALLERLAVPKVVEEKSHAGGISLATYKGDYRLLANVERVFAVGLDLDHFDALPLKMTRRPGQIIPAPTWADVIARFDRVESFVHTTWSSTEESPRVRVFLRLDRGVTGDEYRRIYSYCADLVEGYGFLVDRAASDPSRFWFLPSIPPGGMYRYSIGRGRLIRADVALATVPAPVAPTAPPRPTTAPDADIEDRAAKYVEHCDPAISGSDGHKVTFSTCQKIVRGFGLDEATAYRVLVRWNERCSPPWSEKDLRRKIHEASERGTMAWGELRSRGRAA
jgi:hypothetical protein